MGIWLMFIMLLVWIFWLARRWRLEMEFRRWFAPDHHVRTRLGELALRFHETCRKEIELQQRLMMGGSESNPNIQQELAHASALVGEAKESFWRAVKLAQKLGYIHEKVTSYNRFLPTLDSEKRVI